jgi:hypothetical protein
MRNFNFLKKIKHKVKICEDQDDKTWNKKDDIAFILIRKTKF